jgi:choline dehydrogenase-like flavoprotein
MAAKFSQDDSDVVVIIGSGAGGGTLAHALARQGIRTVVLEAGKRYEMSDIENDEWAMFNKISWLDKRIATGGWDVARNHPNLPAWIVKAVGGSSVHWAGVALRFRDFEFRMRIEHDARGRVTGVVYADAQGRQQRQKARVVCVAGNSIESPRLLLNSESSMFKDGLANSSGQVGRNYMCHTTAGIYAVLPKPVHMYRGTTCAGIISDESYNNTSRGFVGGYRLEILSLGLPFMSAFLDPTPQGWGRAFTAKMERYDHMSGVWLCGEDLPMESNRITLHGTEKDQYGLPIPVVHKDDHPFDNAMRNHGVEQTRKCYEAVGATEVIRLPSYPASHNMGTNRMSAKAADGVVNKWGQSHDIPNLFVSDGSQFTTSGGQNPTLTIVALALRQAEHIGSLINQRAL